MPPPVVGMAGSALPSEPTGARLATMRRNSAGVSVLRPEPCSPRTL
jgi:hypothetical protein